MASLKDIQIGGKGKGAADVGKTQSADKELQKLRRMDLLELLLDSMRENEKNAADAAEATVLSERLKGKLDDKDAQIEHLKERLDGKDARIAELQEALSASEAKVAELEESLRAAVAGKAELDIDALMAAQREAVEAFLAK